MTILSRIILIPRTDIYLLISILILTSHLRLGLHKSLFPLGLPDNILKHTHLLLFWLKSLYILIL